MGKKDYRSAIRIFALAQEVSGAAVTIAASTGEDIGQVVRMYKDEARRVESLIKTLAQREDR